MIGLTSDRRDVIDPSDSKQTTIMDGRYLEIMEEIPEDVGQGPILGIWASWGGVCSWAGGLRWT